MALYVVEYTREGTTGPVREFDRSLYPTLVDAVSEADARQVVESEIRYNNPSGLSIYSVVAEPRSKGV